MTSLSAPLWQLDQDLIALMDSLDTCPEELQSEIEAKIRQYVAAEVDKIDRINYVYTALLMQVASANLEVTRLENRRRAAERAIQRLDGYLTSVIESRHGEPLKGKNVSFSLRHSSSVVISDPEAVPTKFKVVRETVEIPKIPIRDAIKSGEFVPGARLAEYISLVRK